ncbi:hypothetical protein ACH4SP_42205 [Streptomyces sp. NPDC021093]|uniref:hypothetical protein n=1 Tax=Streptomyces sp. NPDC021093 TaxID=3365112 RepID=UPI0037B3AB92
MFKVRRISAITVVVAATLATVVAPVHASEQPTKAPAVKTCYGDAKYFTTYSGTPPFYPARGTYLRVRGIACNDINVKLNVAADARVCTRAKCYGWVSAPKGSWKVIFKNSVKNYEFYMQFSRSTSGLHAD